MSERLEVRIRADKTGPDPEEGQSWPIAGLEIVGDPPAEFDLPANWVRRMADRGLAKLENMKVVERPSAPDPDEVDGSAAVSDAHLLSDSAPHKFLHADAIVLDTTTHGEVRYRVLAQPDKYVDSDDPTDPVTIDQYVAGNTRVDNFYRCALEG